MSAPYVEKGLEGALWGFAAETGLHLLAILRSGALDRFSGLRIVVGHAGEAPPFWLYRLDYMNRSARPFIRNGADRLQRTLSEYMRENVRHDERDGVGAGHYIRSIGARDGPRVVCDGLSLSIRARRSDRNRRPAYQRRRQEEAVPDQRRTRIRSLKVTPVIQVSSIRKTHGRTVAVDDVTFDVEEGEIFGLIGPNGAGKTTTMECVEGLRRPDRGTISVLSPDPIRDARTLQQKVGVQLQQAQLQKRIKVREAVDRWASLYPRSVDGDALLEASASPTSERRGSATLSGGQKQRLFIALALIHDPDVVLLDELTTGLDPQARRAIWDLVRRDSSPGEDGFPDHPSHGGGRASLRSRGHRRTGPRHRQRHADGARAASLPHANRGSRDGGCVSRGAFSVDSWWTRSHGGTTTAPSGEAVVIWSRTSFSASLNIGFVSPISDRAAESRRCLSYAHRSFHPRVTECVRS